jgi:hypothetical protein
MKKEKKSMILPVYQTETPSGQWGFNSLHALNTWIKEMNVDPKTITVYITRQLAEEEWNQHYYERN